MYLRYQIFFCFQDGGADLSKYLPKLYGTARRIHAQFLVFINLREQVFHRNKVEARGSIRKAPNVISWTVALAKLRAAGDKDAGAIIKAWNHGASKQQQLVGGKAQALKNVLGLMPEDVLIAVVIPAVSELSWDKCPWSDDAFANRRVFPGSAPRSGDSAWRERLTPTDASMKIMFQCQVDKHKKLNKTCSPTKLTKAKMDESAEQAALVHSLVGEVRAQVPIPEDNLYDQFVKLWIENDPQVHMEIISVLATKADDFAPPVLDRAPDAHGSPLRPA